MDKKYLYMLVSRDKYELPLIVTNSIGALAQKLDISPKIIRCAINNSQKKGYKSQYVKVEYDEDDE